MANYPHGYLDAKNRPKYIVPFFFNFPAFRDNLLLSFMLGVGIDRQQVWSLTLDFLNVFLMTQYIFIFRNPILAKALKKVFWQFPSKDDKKQWERLDPLVQKQVDWLFNPKPLYKNSETNEFSPQYKDLGEELSSEQKKLAQAQYDFAREYNRLNKYDLNYTLTNYVDLKYQAIWGEELIKEKKWEIKRNCLYFRLVKQGS